VCKIVSGAAALLLLAVYVGNSTAVAGEEDLPFEGTYAKDRLCRGDGSDPADLLVTITGKAIESSMGSCSIMSNKRNGKTISLQVECAMPGNLVLVSDVRFTLGKDNTLDFVDEYNTSSAVLHKCGAAIETQSFRRISRWMLGGKRR